MREKYQNEIEKRIDSYQIGYAFSASDFVDIACVDPTNKALSRLLEEGRIRRIVKGIYDKPEYSKLLNEYSVPNVDNVADALSRKFNWTIAPTGETALNYLHLSTQISNVWKYISDGPYRKYEIGPYLLEFKHCANKETSGYSKITLVVIQAIKAIGKDNILENDIERISEVISVNDKNIILSEAKTATAWVYDVLRRVCINA